MPESATKLRPDSDSVVVSKSLPQVDDDHRTCREIGPAPTQIKLVQKFFSRAEEYSFEYGHCDTPISHFFNSRLLKTTDLLSDFESGKVLDLGCGPAAIGQIFIGRSVFFFGIDVSEPMLIECKKEFKDSQQFNFYLGQIEKLPFRDGYFNVVLCLGALEYIIDTYQALQEMARVLKANGILIISMLNKNSPYRFWQNNIYNKFFNGLNRIRGLLSDYRQSSHRRCPPRPKTVLIDKNLLSAHLKRTGFVLTDCIYYDLRVIPPPLDNYFPKFSVSISRVLEPHSQSHLKHLGTGFLMRCQKGSECL